MARKTIKEQLHDIEQNNMPVPHGYTYNPRHEPRLFKAAQRENQEVANELQIESEGEDVQPEPESEPEGAHEDDRDS